MCIRDIIIIAYLLPNIRSLDLEQLENLGEALLDRFLNLI